MDSVCGGRHTILLDSSRKMLEAFKSTGCVLVFYSDLGIKQDKISNWLTKRDADFEFSLKLYRRISEKSTNFEEKALKTAMHGMEMIARKYGDFYYAVNDECDIEALFAICKATKCNGCHFQ